MRKIILTILLITAYASSYSQDTLSYTREKAVADSIWHENFLKTPEGKYFNELSKYTYNIRRRLESYEIEKGDPDIKAYFIMFEPSKPVNRKYINKRIYVSDYLYSIQYNIKLPNLGSEGVEFYKKDSPIIKPIEYLEELKKYGELIDWEEYIKDIPDEDFYRIFRRDLFGEKLFMIDKNDIRKDSIKIYPTNYNGWCGVEFQIEERRNKKYNIVPPEETKNWVTVY